MTADSDLANQPYLHPVYSGLERTDESVALDPELDSEVSRRLNDIAEARASAAVAGRDYIVR